VRTFYLKEIDVVGIFRIFQNEKFSVAKPRVRNGWIFTRTFGEGHRSNWIRRYKTFCLFVTGAASTNKLERLLQARLGAYP
jgi:hypothetical protein